MTAEMHIDVTATEPLDQLIAKSRDQFEEAAARVGRVPDFANAKTIIVDGKTIYSVPLVVPLWAPHCWLSRAEAEKIWPCL